MERREVFDVTVRNARCATGREGLARVIPSLRQRAPIEIEIAADPSPTADRLVSSLWQGALACRQLHSALGGTGGAGLVDDATTERLLHLLSVEDPAKSSTSDGILALLARSTRNAALARAEEQRVAQLLEMERARRAQDEAELCSRTVAIIVLIVMWLAALLGYPWFNVEPVRAAGRPAVRVTIGGRRPGCQA